MHIYANRVYLLSFSFCAAGRYIKIGSDFTSEWGGYTEIWVVLHTQKLTVLI